MTPATHELFHAIVNADAIGVQRSLAAGADVNATDGIGRNALAYAALGPVIDAIDTITTQPRLSERRLQVLQLISQHPELSLYSLNAPMAWAGGVTLLGLMSWLNMPSEIMYLLDFTQGLLDVNAMDEQGATPLMYAARDGNLSVVQRLLVHGAKPNFRDMSQRSAIQYALPHAQVLWLCEEFLRRLRNKSPASTVHAPGKCKIRRTVSSPHLRTELLQAQSLFFTPPTCKFLIPPPTIYFDATELRRTFEALMRAIRNEDLRSLHMLLFSQSSGDPQQRTDLLTPPTLPSLVNIRDRVGLTLVHHAVSQRRYPSIAVIDVLHHAGADVGLFSTLGFTPLHHLARTARDGDEMTEPEEKHSRRSSRAAIHPLYAFTIHLIRDLRAPLGAKDNKGETPLHAAAEHGRSVWVLRAMLDCDKTFTGKEAVKEVRNERDLRPVDVARQEFLPLFLESYSDKPSQLQPSAYTVSSCQNHVMDALISSSRLHSVHPSGLVTEIVKKESNISLTSRSSASSTSSGVQSCRSHLSHGTYRSQRLYHSSISSINALPTPDPTPPGSFAGSPPSAHQPQISIDDSACSVDILYNLSFCDSALHGYTNYANTYDADMSTLPALSTLSETLLFTRELGTHLFEHWVTKLESVRAEFERARQQLGKTESLRKRVINEVTSILRGQVESLTSTAGLVGRGAIRSQQTVRSERATDSDLHCTSDKSNQLASRFSDEFVAALALGMTGSGLEPTSDTVRGPPYTPTANKGSWEVITSESEVYAALEESERRETKGNDVEHNVSRRPGDIGTEGNALLTESVKRVTKPPRSPLTELDDGATARGESSNGTPSVDFFSMEENPAMSSTRDNITEPLVVRLPSAPIILQRTDRDLRDIVTYLSVIQQSFIRAHETLSLARALLEDAIKIREDQLSILIRMHHRQDLTQMCRLSPISERSISSTSARAPASPTSPIDPRPTTVLGPIEDPRSLRRLLTRKVTKYITNVSDELQKAYIWLRIVREVLRGLERRAAVE